MSPRPRALSIIAPALTLFLGASFSGEATAAAPSPDDPTTGGEASASVSTGGVAAGGGAARNAAPTGNRFRLHVDGEFFGWSHYNPDGDTMGMGEDDQTNFVGFGIGRGLSYMPGEWAHSGAGFGGGGGIGGGMGGSPMMGVGFGVLILDERAVVGARTGMSLGHAAPANDMNARGTSFGGELLPYFRFMFLPGTIRPYVEGHFGFGGSVIKVATEDMDGEQYWGRGHVISPIVGAGGGAMLFLNEHFSVDLGLNFDFLAPHTRETYSDNQDVLENTDWEKHGNLIALTLNTGISGWF
jgi:hypothetical protein